MLIEDDEVDFLGFQLFCEICKVTDGTGKPVEACHQELIAFAHERQCACKFKALRFRRSGFLFLEDLLRSRGFEFADLRFEVLPRRRNAGVSDFHVSNVFRDYETKAWDTI